MITYSESPGGRLYSVNPLFSVIRFPKSEYPRNSLLSALLFLDDDSFRVATPPLPHHQFDSPARDTTIATHFFFLPRLLPTQCRISSSLSCRRAISFASHHVPYPAHDTGARPACCAAAAAGGNGMPRCLLARHLKPDPDQH